MQAHHGMANIRPSVFNLQHIVNCFVIDIRHINFIYTLVLTTPKHVLKVVLKFLCVNMGVGIGIGIHNRESGCDNIQVRKIKTRYRFVVIQKILDHIFPENNKADDQRNNGYCKYSACSNIFYLSSQRISFHCNKVHHIFNRRVYQFQAHYKRNA